ncbi:CAP domain-containing protein [Nonomuraea sp. K274]|uniref:CAP domain-containing protein n=1 Tax=Nonomuraea cypriaca TaxID=1187855 RepID=A0A931AJI6_9ACTN|nr:CAP domain-containing protein [Nonomuraea cypriaca]MBF8192870.1 CAP domain-containing protein [Nonomuraea cypriaca]
MRRPLGVLAGLVSAVALCPPITAAEAVTADEAAMSAEARCRVSVAKPRLNDTGKIESTATRRGCLQPALFRIRILRAVPGRDPVVKSGATKEGPITLAQPCKPGTYYAFATDYLGHTVRSKPVKLSCSPTQAKPPSSGTAGTVGTAMENEVVRLTNAERAKGGCRPLKHDPQLRAAAFGHSKDMAAKGYFDHESQDGRDFMDRIRAAGFSGGTTFAENIAAGQPTAAAVVQGWMESPGHRQNIMNCSLTLIGVGAARSSSRYGIYWTQDFAGR